MPSAAVVKTPPPVVVQLAVSVAAVVATPLAEAAALAAAVAVAFAVAAAVAVPAVATLSSMAGTVDGNSRRRRVVFVTGT